ncbi:hypothetical protein B0J13DRAFT_621450 [Dactylonectria estremocensis]|uniref:F-box domain-containing protein n=1 Tax=Dactylonectria estremocensis TaxID=1079267 RepID=A0A9P9F0K7_9HYPO|nr:hypothetical protein B0J13DRAFT_621450 [Dactylonectria estremocensis]
MSLLKLPIEIVSLIAEHLHIDHLFDFGQTCHHFRYILRNESICRKALQTAKFSPEAVEAQALHAYARGLRRLVKRRNAVRYAEPYLVAIVAMVESFVYANGVLCYTIDRENLHILDVHQSADEELVLRIPWMLRNLACDSQWSTLSSFRPLHYSHGILSSLYSDKDSEGETTTWLVVLRIKDLKVLAFRNLDSTVYLFVRNNDEYLVYGTKSQPGLDGHRRWALQRLDLRGRERPPPVLVLWNLNGSRLGQNICFEIFDNHFYCLSNRNKVRQEHGRWNNYYHVVRFPLCEATRESCKSPPLRNLWRRHAAEGPVDERWETLQLVKDECSGKLFIFDSRRECLTANAMSQRTCYKKEIRFEETDENTDLARHPMAEIINTLPRQESSDDESRDPNAWDSETHAETRPPENVHVGDDGALGSMFTIGECFVRFYNPSCETFVDLIDESQRLRLRVRPKLDASHEDASDVCHTKSPETREAFNGSKDLHHGVKFWPPDQTLPHSPEPAQLRSILYPQIPMGEIDWAMDDRTLIYAPGHAVSNGPRPLVLVSFDPAIRLPSFAKLRLGSAALGGSDGLNISPPNEPRTPAEHLDIIPKASASSANAQGVSATDLSGAECQRDEPNATQTGQPWAMRYPALYMRIPKTEASPCGFDMSF